MKVALLLVGSLLIVLTMMSRARTSIWWVRIADFPRLQIAVGLAVTLVAYAGVYGIGWRPDAFFSAALALALAFQLFRIFPYLPIAPVQVARATSVDPDRSIRLLVMNILMENRRSDDVLNLIEETDPDVVLAVETDEWWDDRLRALDEAYPHSVRHPQGNYYGMHLFSRLELISPEVRYLVDQDIPSIRTSICLPSGECIDFFGVHPRPPDPGQDTETRNAEILLIAREMKADRTPAIVAGDLNDVAWSHTTRLFQRISSALDPRRGRGMFSTFHAAYPIFRWPLDHIFHEASFTLVRLVRCRSIGSDHFPVFAELQYQPRMADEQEAPAADAEDRSEARSMISAGAKEADD